jgi:cullin 3
MHGNDEPNFDKVWAELAVSFRQIHEKQASTLSYEELYRAAYQLVLKKRGELLYDNVVDFERGWLAEHVQKIVLSLVSSELTTPPSIGGSVFGASVAERRIAGERLLKGLRSEWEDQNLCLNMISDVTMYLVGAPPSLAKDLLITGDTRSESIA